MEIKKLTLKPEQIISRDECENLIAGGSYVMAGHSWECRCTKQGDQCTETWFYKWNEDISDVITAIEELAGGIYSYLYHSSHGYNSSYYLHQRHELRRIYHGTKDHTDIGNPIVKPTITCL